MAQLIEELVLSWLQSWLWRGFSPWPGNFHILRARPKRKKKIQPVNSSLNSRKVYFQHPASKRHSINTCRLTGFQALLLLYFQRGFEKEAKIKFVKVWKWSQKTRVGVVVWPFTVRYCTSLPSASSSASKDLLSTYSTPNSLSFSFFLFFSISTSLLESVTLKSPW